MGALVFHKHILLFVNCITPYYVFHLPYSSIQEKIGVNLGFVGCIQSLSAGQVDKYKSYRLDYPNPNTEILDGLDVGKE